MASAWIEDLPKTDEFKDLLALHASLRSGKTADPVRLRLKIQRIWDSLPMAKKTEYSPHFAKVIFEDWQIKVVQEWKGIIDHL